MEFVEWAHTFVGFQPLPNAEELIAKVNADPFRLPIWGKETLLVCYYNELKLYLARGTKF